MYKKIQIFKIAFVTLIYVIIAALYFSISNSPDLEVPIRKQDKGVKGESKDTIQINFLIKEAERLLNINLNHSYSLAKRALVISKSIGYHEGYANAELVLAKYYFQKNEHAKCVKTSYRISKYAEETGNYKIQCQAFNLIGRVFLMQDMYDEAQDFFIKSLKIAEKNQDIKFQALAYIMLGLVYKDKLDYYQAITYFKKAKQLYEIMNYKEGISDCYTELGLIYTAQRNFYYAEQSFQKALEDIQQDDPHVPICNIHLGNIYLNKKEINQALKYYRSAEKSRASKEDNLSFALSHLCQSIAFSELKTWDSTIFHAHKAIEAAKNVGNKDIVSKSYQHLAQIFYEKKDYKKAFDYLKKVNSLQDSILNENKNWELGKLQAKFEFSSKIEEEERKRNLEEQKRKEKIANHYLLIGAFLPLLFAMVIMITNANVSPSFLKALTFVTIILSFEFILVVLDPHIENFTGGIPITKLAINSLLAFIFAPLHYYLERSILKRASMKKTILVKQNITNENAFL
jgi:tetratricopeptide (TPR) repeat protein